MNFTDFDIRTVNFLKKKVKKILTFFKKIYLENRSLDFFGPTTKVVLHIFKPTDMLFIQNSIMRFFQKINFKICKNGKKCYPRVEKS